MARRPDTADRDKNHWSWGRGRGRAQEGSAFWAQPSWRGKGQKISVRLRIGAISLACFRPSTMSDSKDAPNTPSICDWCCGNERTKA
jgi:hypothetical protein